MFIIRSLCWTGTTNCSETKSAWSLGYFQKQKLKSVCWMLVSKWFCCISHFQYSCGLFFFLKCQKKTSLITGYIWWHVTVAKGGFFSIFFVQWMRWQMVWLSWEHPMWICVSQSFPFVVSCCWLFLVHTLMDVGIMLLYLHLSLLPFCGLVFVLTSLLPRYNFTVADYCYQY